MARCTRWPLTQERICGVLTRPDLSRRSTTSRPREAALCLPGRWLRRAWFSLAPAIPCWAEPRVTCCWRLRRIEQIQTGNPYEESLCRVAGYRPRRRRLCANLPSQRGGLDGEQLGQAVGRYADPQLLPGVLSGLPEDESRRARRHRLPPRNLRKNAGLVRTVEPRAQRGIEVRSQAAQSGFQAGTRHGRPDTPLQSRLRREAAPGSRGQ